MHRTLRHGTWTPGLLLLLGTAPACEATDAASSSSAADTAADSTDGGAGGTADTRAGGSTEEADSSGGQGSGTAGEPPRACDFAAGCYEAGVHRPTGTGIRSEVWAGCEGGDFALAASFALPPAQEIHWAYRTIPLLGDFDGDGQLDLFTNIEKHGPSLWLGLGDGTFEEDAIRLASPNDLTLGGGGVTAGDLDGDGTLDPFAADLAWGAAAWRNDGSLGFAAAWEGLRPGCSASSCPEGRNGVAVGDVNGDGHLDALLTPTDVTPTGSAMLAGNGDGGWQTLSAPQIQGSAWHSQFADMDGDGDVDLFSFATGTTTSLAAQVFRNDDGSWAPAGVFPNTRVRGSYSQEARNPRQGAVGDVNCDGIPDLAAGGSIYLGNGTGFTHAVDVNDADFAALADMNGDGHLDLITQRFQDGLTMHHGDGTGQGWMREVDGLPDQNYIHDSGSPIEDNHGFALGDLDGNGAIDVVRIARFRGTQYVEAWVR